MVGQSIRREWLGLVVGVIAALAWTAGRVAVPWLVQRAIDTGIAGDGSLIGWGLVIAAAGVVSGTFTGMRRYWAFRNARRVEAHYRNRLFTHAQRLHFGYHDRVQTGDLMSRANTDLQQFQNVHMMLPITFGNLVVVLTVTALLLATDVGLTILALAFLPLVNVLGRRFGQRLHPAVMGIQNESAQLASVVEESVAGVRVVKGFGAERLQRDRLSVEADDVYDQSMAAARVRSIHLPAIELLPNIGLILVLWRGGQLVIDGSMTVGQLVSFNIYVAMLIQPLRMLGMIISASQRASAAGQRIQTVLATEPTIVDPREPVALPDGDRRGRVELDAVSFGYEPEHHDADRSGDGDHAPERLVLDRLDLVIEPGETVAIVGATGSGKSTIARLLPRFYDVTGGSIRLDGVDVRDIELAELRRAVGIVFEDTFLFSSSVADNIAFAEPGASRERIERAARLAGAHDFIIELESGYDTLLGERGYSLSGGQRQRLAIARALLGDPRVVVLDDATSAVDPTKEHEIRDALSEVIGRRTTIVIAHRPATVALADRVVLLDGGRVAAEGTHDELLATNARYRQVLATGDPTAGNGSGGPGHVGPTDGNGHGPTGDRLRDVPAAGGGS